MRGNTRYICYAFVAFALSGCANFDAEKVSQAFATGLAGGAAIYASGASYVQPAYQQPTYYGQPGGTWHLVAQTVSGQYRYCQYANNAVHSVSAHLSCPSYTY